MSTPPAESPSQLSCNVPPPGPVDEVTPGPSHGPRRSWAWGSTGPGFWRRRSSTTAHPPSTMTSTTAHAPDDVERSEADAQSTRSRRRTSSLISGQGATWARILAAAGLRPAPPAGVRDSVVDEPTTSSPAGSTSASSPNSPTATAPAPLPPDSASPLPPAAPMPAPAPAPAQPPLVVTDPGGHAVSPAPEAAHDAAVAQFVRPAVARSMSSPAVPTADAPATLPPLSPQPQGTQYAPPAEAGDSRPVSAMLDGALEPSGTRVTRALGAQIEAVLAAQEQIGKMHLALEGWRHGGEGEADGRAQAESERELERRAKGVEEIMARLGDLSVSLKSYHALGTPSLVFPSRSRGTPPPAAPTAAPGDPHPGFAPLYQSKSANVPRRKLEIRTDLPADSPAPTPHPPFIAIANPAAAEHTRQPRTAQTLTPGTVGGERAALVGERGGGPSPRPAPERGYSEHAAAERGRGPSVERGHGPSGERGHGPSVEHGRGEKGQGKGRAETEDDVLSAPAGPGLGTRLGPGFGTGIKAPTPVSPKRIPGLPRRSGSVPGLLGAGGGALAGIPSPGGPYVQSPAEMSADTARGTRPW